MTAKKSNEKGNNIQKLRIKKKWTQEQVARSMGVRRASVCRWETGVSCHGQVSCLSWRSC